MLLKKIFIVSTILLLLVGVFFGIYHFAFKATPNNTSEDATPQRAEEKSVADMVSAKVTNLTSDRVLGYGFGPNGDTVRYMNASDGRAWAMTTYGTNREELPVELDGTPVSAQWSVDGDAVLVKTDAGAWVTYEFSTQKSTVLRSGMDDVIWSQIAGKILYKYYDASSGERSLNFANADGTQWKKIANLPFRSTRFTQIPLSIFAIFWPQGTHDTPTELYHASTVSNDDVRKVFEGRRGTDYLPSPKGDVILLSTLTDAGALTLATIDTRGHNYTELNVPTLVAKAAWARDGKHVYYAQPTDIPADAVMPDDYFAKKFMTHDTFYKMDITTGKKERIIDLEEITQQFDATDLRVSASGDVLFFINRADGLLYRITL